MFLVGSFFLFAALSYSPDCFHNSGKVTWRVRKSRQKKECLEFGIILGYKSNGTHNLGLSKRRKNSSICTTSALQKC